LAEALGVSGDLIVQQRGRVVRQASHRQECKAPNRPATIGRPQPIDSSERIDGVAVSIPRNQPAITQIQSLSSDLDLMGAPGEQGSGVPAHVPLQEVDRVDLGGVDGTA
jgi:hypothetical protein